MGLFTGREVRAASWGVEPPIPPYPATDASGRVTTAATPEAALQLSAVWACQALLANSVSILKLEAFRETSQGILGKLSPQPDVLRKPGGRLLQSAWINQAMWSLGSRGNAIGIVTKLDALQRPAQVDLINPDRVRMVVDDDTGELTYWWVKSGAQIDPRTVWHCAGYTLPGSPVGLSPLSYAAKTVGLNLSAQQFGLDYLTGSGNPKGLLESDQEIDQEQAQTIKDRFLAATRSREPVVMGAGLTYRAIQITPEESQFLATQHAGIADVARYFGVPPEMVGGPSGGGMQYSNREQRALDFVTFTTLPWMRRLEDSLSEWFADDVQVAFNPAALLRVDAETRAKVHVQQLAGKTRTPTEIRAEDNLPPFTDAQAAEADLVPLAITPNGGVKALDGLKTPPGPAAPTPANDQTQQQENPQ